VKGEGITNPQTTLAKFTISGHRIGGGGGGVEHRRQGRRKGKNVKGTKVLGSTADNSPIWVNRKKMAEVRKVNPGLSHINIDYSMANGSFMDKGEKARTRQKLWGERQRKA